MTAPTRPVLRWHGGKWKLAPWIISHFPKHRVYVEPFGGAASVLLRKERSYAEVYNDLDTDVVTLFRVLRDASSSTRLIELLKLTPFAKLEFEESYKPALDHIEIARRLLIRSFMGFGSNGHNAATKTGFRSNSNRSGTTPAHDWAHYPDLLPTIIARLTGVVIKCRDACEVMSAHDELHTLHYVDPPYMIETRSKSMHRDGCYTHELDRGGAHPAIATPPDARRHGRTVRLSARGLRGRAERLAAHRDRRARRRRKRLLRSPLAQSILCCSTRQGTSVVQAARTDGR